MTYPRFVVAQQKTLADMYNGDVFSAELYEEGVVDDDFISYLVRTNQHAGKMNFQGTAGGLANLRMYENPSSINVAGNAHSFLNRNRNSAQTSVMTITDAASIQGGTELFNGIVGGAAGHPHAVAGGESGLLFILASSTDYYVELKNISGGATNLMLEIVSVELL